MTDNHAIFNGDRTILAEIAEGIAYNDDITGWESRYREVFDIDNPDHQQSMLDFTRREYYQNYLCLKISGKCVNWKQVNPMGDMGKIFHPNATSDGYTSMVKLFNNGTAAKVRAGLMGKILNYLNENHKVDISIEDKRTHVPQLTDEPVYSVGGMTLRPDQRKVIDEFRAGIADHENQGDLFSNILLKLAPNTGKTYIAAALVANLVNPRVIMMHRDKYLCARAVADYLKLGFDVGCLSADKAEVRKVLKEQGCDREPIWGVAPFTVAMVQTVVSQLKRGAITVDELQEFDTLLADECEQLMGDQTTELIDKMRLSMKFGYSATPLGSDSGHNRITVSGMFGGQVYEITTADNIDLGVSLKPHVHFNLNRMLGVKNLTPSRAKNHIYTCEYRLDLMVKRMLWHIGEGHNQFLVYYGGAELKYGDWLYKELQQALGLLSVTAHVNGTTKDRSETFTRYLAFEVNTLVANSVIKRGVNLKNIQVVCNWESTDNEISLEQALIGRGTRVDGEATAFFIEDFYDVGNEFLESNSRRRLEMFLKVENGATVTYSYPNDNGTPA